MGQGLTQSPWHGRVVSLPPHHKARFRQQARFLLVLVTTLGAALAAPAAGSGHDEFAPVMGAIAIVPLLGGLIYLWRLVAA